MSWKDVITKVFFCFVFVFNLTVMRYSKKSYFFFVMGVRYTQARLGSFITGARRQVNVWSKSGRPVSSTTVFADCGRLAGVFLNSSGALKCLVQIFMDKCLRPTGRSSHFKLFRWPPCVLHAQPLPSPPPMLIQRSFHVSFPTSLNYSGQYRYHFCFHANILHPFIYIL